MKIIRAFDNYKNIKNIDKFIDILKKAAAVNPEVRPTSSLLTKQISDLLRNELSHPRKCLKSFSARKGSRSKLDLK